MPRVVPKPHFDHDELVTPVQPFSWGEGVYNPGTLLHGDDPAVVANPWNWRKAEGVAEGEGPNPWADVTERISAIAEENPSPSMREHLAKAQAIPPEHSCICEAGFDAGPKSFRVGHVYDRRDPLVAKHAQYFSVR